MAKSDNPCAVRTVRVICELEIPEGATHYWGTLGADATYAKFTVDPKDGWTVWCYWSSQRKQWYLYLQGPTPTRPYWVKEIPYADQVKT